MSIRGKSKMPVTLDDIAAATGFDKSTVSLTLRNAPRAARFASETRARIHAAAERLEYRPNFFARQLSDKKPRMLMLCVNYLRDPFAMRVAEGFEARASQLGFRVLITALQDRENPLLMYRDILGAQGVPAMALVGSSSSKLSEASLRQLAIDGMEIVLVNRMSPDPRIARVGSDDYHGGSLIAEHLFDEAGVRDAWIIVGIEGLAAETRLKAVLDAAAKRNLPAPRVLHCQGQAWVDSAEHVVAESLASAGRPPEAVIGMSDVFAVGAGRALAKVGLRVGRDVALTGYDDGIYAESFWPPLTTIRLPMTELGSAAADALIGMLESPQRTAPQVILPVHLMRRQSSSRSQDSQETNRSNEPRAVQREIPPH